MRPIGANGKWYGDEIENRINKDLSKKLYRGAIMLARHAAKEMSRSGGVSAPGEYPYKQSGHLRGVVANAGYEVDPKKLTARWGTNVKYGKWLETGTRNMAARPWMSMTNQAMASRLGFTFKKKLK